MSPWREVVGLVADVKLNGVMLETPMQAYLPIMQESSRGLALVIRTATDPASLGSAVDAAVHQKIDDVELYRVLFWNDSLGLDELILFGEKLAREFRHIAYDVYMWLANVFEVLYGKKDNYEMAVTYYQKAAAIKPSGKRG